MTHYYRPQKSNESSDETHSHRHDRPTDMPMVVSFSAAFRGEYGEKLSLVRRVVSLPILPPCLVITAVCVPIKGGILPLQGFA
mgnify:CR=1 FL=1